MKQQRLYILSFVLLASLAGCERHIPEERVLDKDSIEFGTSEIDTKGFLGRDDLNYSGTKIQVVDYVTNFSGTLDGHTYQSTEGFPYIDDNINYDSSAAGTDDDWYWKYENKPSYLWTNTGIHSFYGWLVNDGLNGTAVNTLFTPSIDISQDRRQISIPATELTTQSSQVDFVYSDQVVRIAGNPGYKDKVNFKFSHLFAAMAVGIRNESEDEVYITSVRLKNFYNKKSAMIDYSNTGVAALTNVDSTRYVTSPSNIVFPNCETQKTLVEGARLDVYSGAVSTNDSPTFFMMWPQSKADLNASPSPRLELNYQIKDDWVDDSHTALVDHRATFNFRDLDVLSEGMEHGHKYLINLLFRGESIDLTINILEWNYVMQDIDYTNSSISANGGGSIPHDGTLWFYDNNNSSTQYATREATLQSGQVLRGEFYIESPRVGAWAVTTYPAEAAKYFVLEPSTGVIDDSLFGVGKSGKVTFTLRASNLIPTSNQVLHFNVSIQLNGTWHDANSEFNRKDWKITREAVN